MTATVETLAAAGLLIGSLAAWSLLLRRRMPGDALVPYEPRTPVRWDVAALAPVVIAFIVIRLAAMEWAGLRIQGDDELRTALAGVVDEQAAWGVPGYAVLMFQAAAASQLVTALAVVVFLMSFHGAPRDDLGFSMRRLGGDLRFGLVGFFALAAPAVILQAVLQTLIAKSQHPIVLAFQRGADLPTVVWAAVAAVVVAPIVEEFLFRGVLQGALERMWSKPEPSSPDEAQPPPSEVTEPPSAAPIVISSALFALMHLGSGVDVVPLFFLALGLGYLYRQTHRLWPGIVVHTLLNAFSLAMLLAEAAAARGN